MKIEARIVLVGTSSCLDGLSVCWLVSGLSVL
jgi:hypothetical protein